jgi:hypothetical protein
MEAVKFEMDTRAMDRFFAARKKFPRQSGKWAAKMVNDMAFQFKEEFPKIIRTRYTVRDPKFIERIIRVEKARPRSKPCLSHSVR